MATCAVCQTEWNQLDHGVCPPCMLAASQALLTAADLWRESIAAIWIRTHQWQDDFWVINALYNDANQYIRDLIDWQSDYSTALYNATVEHCQAFWPDFFSALAAYAVESLMFEALRYMLGHAERTAQRMSCAPAASWQLKRDCWNYQADYNREYWLQRESRGIRIYP